MKINWNNVIEKIIGGLATTVIIAFVVYIYHIVTGQKQASMWLWVGLIVLVIIILIAPAWKTFQNILKAIGKWIISNWQLIIGITLQIIVAYEIFLLTTTLLAMFLTLALAFASILLAKYRLNVSSHNPDLPVKVSSSKNQYDEGFENGLKNWQYFGKWTIGDENGNKFLIVTDSNRGGFFKPCLSWKDYVFEFETKIVNKTTTWDIRAKNADNYVMLQCTQHNIYPHYRMNNKWVNLDGTKGNGIPLPVPLALNTWFGVRIDVNGTHVSVTLIVDGKKIPIPNIPSILKPPIAPIEYLVGTVGFRECGNECAHFRKISIKEI